MNSNLGTIWDDPANVETLKRLWADGDSCTQIGGVLGVSRNSIIGKIHRLGLGGRARADAIRHPRKKRVSADALRRSKVVRLTNHGNRFDRVEVMEPAPLPIEQEIDMPLGQRCTLLELNDDTCRWPVGDPCEPGFFFCGGKPATGLPYCGYHARVAYQPASARRDNSPAPEKHGYRAPATQLKAFGV